MGAPRVLVIGDDEALVRLAASGFGADIGVTCRAPDLLVADKLDVSVDCSAELVVLASPRPGTFSDAEVGQLRRTLPLARIWRLLGSWCEGEQRSGTPPAGCTNIYWHQWSARIARESRHDGACLLASMAPPDTTTPDERSDAESRVPLARGSAALRIWTNEREAYSALADVCRLAGYAVLPWNSGSADARPPAAILCDATVERLLRENFIGELRGAGSGAPLLAIAGFIRPDDAEQIVARGAAAVFAKPFAIGDLHAELARLLVA